MPRDPLATSRREGGTGLSDTAVQMEARVKTYIWGLRPAIVKITHVDNGKKMGWAGVSCRKVEIWQGCKKDDEENLGPVQGQRVESQMFSRWFAGLFASKGWRACVLIGRGGRGKRAGVLGPQPQPQPQPREYSLERFSGVPSTLYFSSLRIEACNISHFISQCWCNKDNKSYNIPFHLLYVNIPFPVLY